MDDFARAYRQKREFNKQKEEKFKEFSRNRLYNIAKKKIETTMIGAISTIEKHFAKLIEDERYNELFQNLRSEILDKGNNQIRNLEIEFSKYDIVWNKNNVIIPFKEKE